MARTPKRATREIGAEIMAALLWEPKTWREVEEQVGITDGPTSCGWLKELRRAGVIYVHSYRRPKSGMAPRVFAVQPKPFERPDARR